MVYSRVMILDSNPKDRKNTFRMIKQLLPKAQVLEFADGREALGCALKNLPDILLTEVRCNGLDGLFVAKAFREKNFRVNVIFTTEHHNSKRYALEYFQVQASGCVDKPLKLKELYEVLQKLRFPITC